jgi:hypothetical protein
VVNVGESAEINPTISVATGKLRRRLQQGCREGDSANAIDLGPLDPRSRPKITAWRKRLTKDDAMASSNGNR